MRAIIDSSQQLLFTGILSGNTHDMDGFCDRFHEIYEENGLSHRYHWNELTRKKRDRVKKQMIASMADARGMRLNIIKHRKPSGMDRKGWYLFQVPAMVAQRLESWLRNKNGEVEIIVDDDYNVIRGGRGTEQFTETLMRQIALRLTGRESTVRKDGFYRSDVRQANGRDLAILASVAQRGSKWVGLVDAYLGLYLYEHGLFRDLKNVYYDNVEK